MNLTRNGKIARLPREVREELNRRLHDGEAGTKLRVWLNALPAVRAVLVAEFGGRPINGPNLTAWRQGGYRKWGAEAEARVLAKRLGCEGEAPSPEVSTEMIELWQDGCHLATVHQLTAESNTARRWRLLHGLCDDVTKPREARLRRERQELERQRAELHVATGADPGARQPGHQSKSYGIPLN